MKLFKDKASAPKKKTAISSAKKDVMVEQNKAGKWTVRTTGSVKALKVFDTQSEAAAYGKDIAKRNATAIRVKGTEGKVRQSANFRVKKK